MDIHQELKGNRNWLDIVISERFLRQIKSKGNETLFDIAWMLNHIFDIAGDIAEFDVIKVGYVYDSIPLSDKVKWRKMWIFR